METSEDKEPADTLPVDVAIARYQEALAAGRRDVPRVSPAQPTTPARHRMHLLLARWLEY
jgi:hypothetical protein